jgi:hypothetical protein
MKDFLRGVGVNDSDADSDARPRRANVPLKDLDQHAS